MAGDRPYFYGSSGSNARCDHQHRSPVTAARCAMRFTRPQVRMQRGRRSYLLKRMTAFRVIETGEVVLP